MRTSAALLFLLAGCATGSGGGRARDFSLRDMNGKTVRLSDHLGKDVVVMSFWATWCAPCVAELPHLEKMYQAHRAKGFVVLAISMDGPETVAEVEPTARRLGLTFPVLFDSETRAVASHNPHRDAPFTVVIDRGGKMVTSKPGYSPGDEVELEKQVVALLAGPAPGP